jgi:hypothetical protein
VSLVLVSPSTVICSTQLGVGSTCICQIEWGTAAHKQCWCRHLQ